MKTRFILLLLLSLIIYSGLCTTIKQSKIENIEEKKVELGKLIFFDKNLSNPAGLSCSSCHSPEKGFSDHMNRIISEGAVSNLFGNRNAPSIAYSKYIPPLEFNVQDSIYTGGLFYDGRVNSLEEQAEKPFLHQLEMNNANPEMVISKIKKSSYYSLYKKIYGRITNNEIAFKNICEAITNYEKSQEVNAFTSKFDYVMAGKIPFTEQEKRGWELFNDTTKAKCANCHISTDDETHKKILFTDFTYDNLGVPKNPKNPYYSLPTEYNSLGSDYIDNGLGKIINDDNYNGQFRVPTLRNIELSAPYFHNGVYKTLEEVVHFYNSRDKENIVPEVGNNVNKEELGNLGLTEAEEKDIVAFLKTLTDGYELKK